MTDGFMKKQYFRARQITKKLVKFKPRSFPYTIEIEMEMESTVIAGGVKTITKNQRAGKMECIDNGWNELNE